jgi:signal transduction histidine kinase
MGAGRSARDNEQVNGHSIDVAPRLPREARGWLPRLITAMRAADPRAALKGRQVAADIVLTAAAMAAALAMASLAARYPGGNGQGPIPVPAGGPAGWQGWQAALPTVAVRMAPLAIRRFRPLTAFWLCAVVCLLTGSPEATTFAALPENAAIDFIALAPAAYAALVYSRYQTAALLSTPLAVVAIVSRGLGKAQAGNYTLVATVLVFIGVLVVGHAVRLSRRRASDSQARLLQLQEKQEESTRQAIGHERARIASELHDVVTHNVSMMVVQAGAARRVLGASPDEARSALLAIEESGRAAITELQHMLGLLAVPGGPEDAGRPVGQDTTPLRPQPGLDEIGPLIDRVTAAGLLVELRVSGAPRALPPGLDLAAYRVVQEALTNVIKHAGHSSATVVLDYRDDALVVEVANDGGPGRTAASHYGAPGTLNPMPGGGRGLLGLRERVVLYGGELDARSRTGGGWRVRARFPQQPSLAAVPVPS